MASGTTFLRGLSLIALFTGCVASNTGGTGGAGGSAAAGSGGGGGTGGSGGSGGGALPDYGTTVAAGKIAGRTFTFVTGFVGPIAGDADSMQVEMLGFSPELADTPCWNKPPAGSSIETELSVIFKVPRAGGAFEWGSGKTVAGSTTVTLVAANASGNPTTSTSDRAKVTVGAMPAQAGLELTGSVVIQADANNTVNGTFDVRRCDR